MADYTGFGQQLQANLTSSTFFWLVTVTIVVFLVAVFIGGFKKVASPGRLKWLVLHALSIFLIGYCTKGLVLNKYATIVIFAAGVTALSAFYRYLIYNVSPEPKIMGIWLGINLITFFIIQILYEVIGVTNPLLQIVFASIFITLAGSVVNRKFKRTN